MVRNVYFLFILLMILSTIVFAQNAISDGKMTEIEKFKGYKVMRIHHQEDLDLVSDSTIKVTEIVNYYRKSKKNASGKATVKAKTKDGAIDRTYYFNQSGKLFAIVDIITSSDRVSRLTYYFNNGKLAQVTNENNENVTSSIDKERLYQRIQFLWPVGVIN